MVKILLATFATGVAAVGPDCSTLACPSTCSCVESTCGNLYAGCAADSQCDGIMNCLFDCSCGNVFCALSCVAGKTLNTISSNVKTCAGGCASSLDESWESYKVQFKKVFDDDLDEATRKQIFAENNKQINELNDKNGEFVFGWTRETDRKEEEKHKKGAKRPTHKMNMRVIPAKMTAPAVVDWRDTPAVSPVKNQGQCGSCWAFSATETIESEFAILQRDTVGWKSGASDIVELSPQQITSCVTSCDGCGGGWPYLGYEYVSSVAGLSNEWYWPYTQSMVAQTATAACSTNVTIFDGPDASLAGGHVKVTGSKYVIPECSSGACDKQDMAGLAAAVAEGPVSVCVNAGAWNSYTGGVLSQAACGGYAADDLDHCVQLVGYNSTASSPYWIVRNSWSTTWGMDGYVHLEYPANTCGLGNEATKPILGKQTSKMVV